MPITMLLIAAGLGELLFVCTTLPWRPAAEAMRIRT